MRVLLSGFLVLLLGGCETTATSASTALDSTVGDAASDLGVVDAARMPDADSMALDMGVDASLDAAIICPDSGPCQDGQRRVGCACFDDMDRRCLTDGDCRADERCEEIRGALRICRFEPPPLRRCPSEACPSTADRQLSAAFASRDVTPLGFEPPTPAGLDGVEMAFDPPFPEGTFLDCGLDGLCLGDDGYPGPDEGEGDGVMQAIWLAGFSHGRPAQYCPPERIGCDAPDCCVSKFAHDPITVQVAVVRQGGLTVAFVSVDTVGLFHTDIDRIRGRVAPLGVDLLLMAATHNHEGPDTAGQWGPGNLLPVTSGRTPSFIAAIEDETVAAVQEAIGDLRPATLRAGVLDVGVEGLAVTDSRAPYIFNDDLPILHFVDHPSGQAIGTLVSFGSHPESLWAGNPYISSDYPHYLRHYVRRGLAAVEGPDGIERPALPGTDADVVFFAGSLGGLIHPGGGGALDYGGWPPEGRRGFPVADALGQRLAGHVLGAIHGDTLRIADVDDSPLRFATKRFLVEAENEVFRLAASVLGVIERHVYNATSVSGAYLPGLPQVQTQVAVVRLGPVTVFTAPGEVFAETLCGGYPGRYHVRDPVIGDTEERRVPAQCDAEGLPVEGGTHPCIIRPGADYPPDWSEAPGGPYVYELIPGEVPFFIGLGMDFLGYMVPPYDFVAPAFTSAAPGDHYEETNSVGVSIVPLWRAHLEAVLEAL